MLVTVVVNILNIIGNYSLIFGKLGMPELGVEGAAISTAFSRGVAMVLLFVILLRKHIRRFPLAWFRPFPVQELRNLLKVGLPSAGEQLSYSSSQVVITFFINMMGAEALAARTYCVNIIMFAYLFCIAIAQGGAICIGHLVGQQRPHAAFILGKYVMKRAVGITLLLSTTIALAGPTILGFLTQNEHIIHMGTLVLMIDVVLEIGRRSTSSPRTPCGPSATSTTPSTWGSSSCGASPWGSATSSAYTGGWRSAACGQPSRSTRTSAASSSSAAGTA